LFFSNFYTIAAALCVVTQLFLTSRFLRKFGIGPALFIVPMVLLLGTAALLVWGTLLAAIFLRSGDQVLRYSIDKSTVELLYLPVSDQIKLQVKAVIDTVIWRVGDGFASLTLAFFVYFLGWSAQQVSWINLVFILTWLGFALDARRRYVSTLEESIREHRLDLESVTTPVLDRKTTAIFTQHLSSTDTDELLYALKLFDVSSRPMAHPALRGLLSHSHPEVRARSLAILNASGDRGIRTVVEGMMGDTDLRVRTEAMLYLSQYTRVDPLERIRELGDFSDYSVQSAIIAYLSKSATVQGLEYARIFLRLMREKTGPAEKQSRREAAHLLGQLPAYFEDELRQLMADDDPEVVRHAIVAVGKQTYHGLLPELLDRLIHRQNTEVVVEALAGFGGSAVDILRECLNSATFPRDAREDLISVLSQIGTPAAAGALGESILNPDIGFRLKVIAGLNKLHTEHPELPRDETLLETVLAAELIGHYRTYQVLAALNEESPDAAHIRNGITTSLGQEVERIFRLLSLLHPLYDFHSAHVALESKEARVRDNAIELLDNILKPEIRHMLVPLLDGGVSLREKAVLANKFIGVEIRNREDAAACLINSDDPWLKSCGAFATASTILEVHSWSTKIIMTLSFRRP